VLVGQTQLVLVILVPTAFLARLSLMVVVTVALSTVPLVVQAVVLV
jgi:hypothetical protein